jgi:hypothetical protein
MVGAAKWGFGIARYFLGYAHAVTRQASHTLAWVPRLLSSFPRQLVLLLKAILFLKK